MYNFADSTVTASAFTAGANTGLTLVASTAGLTTTAALVIYYDDQLASTTVTVSSLPAISGTVTANILSLPDNANGFFGDGHNNLFSLFESGSLVVAPISGTVTVGNTVNFLSGSDSDTNLVENIAAAMSTNSILGITNALPAGTNRIGVVTASLSAGTAQIGSVTASISGTVPISISSVTVGNSVTIGSLPAISGTVTANSSNGSLTTRFGSVTTANTAFSTSAVTNSNRKYLLIQNVTTASNVITVGIGFTPTTTQGIQLLSGAGLTFESSYIPTGAVNLLSSVTASCFTILEA
jgi:hypothetical protein